MSRDLVRFPISAVPESDRAKLAGSWQMRAMLLLEEAERRNGDPMFRILLAALHKNPPGLPLYAPAARVDKTGMVWCDVCTGEDDKGRPVHFERPLMLKAELARRVQGVVDALDLSLVEAQAFCKEMAAWIYEDKSPDQMTVDDRVPLH